MCGSSIFQNFSIPLWCKSLYSLSFPGQLARQENPWKICDAEVLISSLPPSLATVAAAKRSAWEEFVVELRQAVQVPCWEPWCVDLSGIYLVVPVKWWTKWSATEFFVTVFISTSFYVCSYRHMDSPSFYSKKVFKT